MINLIATRVTTELKVNPTGTILIIFNPQQSVIQRQTPKQFTLCWLRVHRAS